MKKIILVIIGLGVILGGIAYKMVKVETITIDKIKTEVVEKVVEVPSNEPEFEKRAREAINASSTEIEAAVEKAAQAKRENMENQIRLQVTRQMREELDEQEATLEEKVSFH